MKQQHRKPSRPERKTAAVPLVEPGGRFVLRDKTSALLEAVIQPGDRVCLEGDNQKQADWLARALVQVNPAVVHDLHMVQSTIALTEHIEVFRKGIARRLDFAYSGPQSRALFELAAAGQVEIGAIHTYLELFSRYYLDLVPNVSLLVADACDAAGNLFTGFSTEDTPTIAEATHFGGGLTVVQVKERVDRLPRVDIPADWIDFIIVTGEDYHLQPLFTRDPARVTARQILMGMMVLKGIYGAYGVRRLNHGVGFPTAAIELLLPTYGVELGLLGSYCTHWALNPHPTLIPAIEAGFVERIHCFGGEPGMEAYVSAHPDIFPVGPEGHLRSNRCACHLAGLYGIDLFAGATLQIDRFGNSSTAIQGMIAGFGGAPNLGSTPPGRRHVTAPFRQAGGRGADGLWRGRKLVVQITPTVSEKKGIPVFVDELDALDLQRQGIFDEPPVMISGDQVTHIVTECGIAFLDRCPDADTRCRALAAVAGETEVGQRITREERDRLRRDGIVQTPSDLKIDPASATPDRLAAHSIQDLVDQSRGLYMPPPGV